MSQKATNFTMVRVENSGHFLMEEQPEFVENKLIEFFQ
jgi:pimeloyl-ACP methyl ester carboxylesterase